MDFTVRQCQSQQQRIDTQNIFERLGDWHAPALPDESHRFAKGVDQRLLSGLSKSRIGFDQERLAGMLLKNLHHYRIRALLFEKLLNNRSQFGWILIWHQAK